MKRVRKPELPLKVRIQTAPEFNRGRPWMEYEVRQDDLLVEFYQDGEHIYTASSGEVFGHDYFMQILEDVINSAMLLKEGRVSEAKLIGQRFLTAFHVNQDELEGEDNGG